MSYPLLPSVSLMEAASTMACDLIGTQPDLQAFLKIYLNGGRNPYNGSNFQGFFNLTNANLYGGDWRVVWGPCIYVDPTLGNVGTPTNAMYVAFSPSQKTYAVCIAGTNPLSSVDWIYEDADAIPFYAAAWPPTLPFVLPNPVYPPIAAPAVSAATATGLSDLLTQPQMIDPTSGTNLQQFLTAKTDANATLIFAGHSLAGALAPALALYLYPTPNASGWKNVFVLALAGATPGNPAFADLFTKAFPKTADSTGNWFWNIDYANECDVVPHGWDKLDKIVGSAVDGNFPSIWGVLDGSSGWSSLGNTVSHLTYVGSILADGYYAAITQSWFQPSWGYYNGSTWSPLPTYTNQSPLTWSGVATVIEATHTDQYFKYFGVAPPPAICKPDLLTVSPEAAMFGTSPATRPRRRTGGPKGLMALRPPAAR